MPDLWRDIRSWRGTVRYQRLRGAYMREHPLCAHCLREGRHVAADELDHVIPAIEAPERFFDSSNWQALCRPCHERKSAGELSGMTDERRAWLDLVDGI